MILTTSVPIFPSLVVFFLKKSDDTLAAFISSLVVIIGEKKVNLDSKLLP